MTEKDYDVTYSMKNQICSALSVKFLAYKHGNSVTNSISSLL